MIWIALTLGFVGSLHCVAMCGPLAILACNQPEKKVSISVIKYNLGRIVTYTLMGGVFGILGTFLFVITAQKWIAIVIGSLMILSIFSFYNIDALINRIPLVKSMHGVVGKLISKYTQTAKRTSAFILGLLNGLIPCGLVYLALIGALSSPHWTDSMLFMAAFGLGTVPAMLGLVTGYSLLSFKKKRIFNKILPIVTFSFGAILIYRGFVVEMPMELDFWEAMKNPILCH